MSRDDAASRTGMTLDPVAAAAAVRAERTALADLVEGLDDTQWSTQSLCEAWTVRHVVAHLTTASHVRLPELLVNAVRARGSFDRMEVQTAARLVDRHTDPELVALLRESAESERRMPLSKPMDPLMDVVIHTQDIVRPLGLPYASPPAVVAASLAHVAGDKLMGGPKRLAGVRITSTDTGWSTGDGLDVSGPDIDLLLAVAGRPAGLDALSGPGLDRLASQL